MNKQEELKKEIADKKRELQILEQQEKLQGRTDAIKSLKEYSIEEKIAWFDKSYEDANRSLKIKEKECGEEEFLNSEDEQAYAWESHIEILARDSGKFWKYWNNL